MSFICSLCHKASENNVKPIRVVEATRGVHYENIVVREDEFENRTKEKIHSEGQEIVSELALCATDAAERFGIKEHAITATRSPVRGFTEISAAPFKVSVIYSAGLRAAERYGHRSKRGRAEAEATIPLIKQFLDENPKIVL